MKKFILAKKLKMTRIFDENGKIIPVTVLEAEPCFVVQIKTKEKDGYNAIQIGCGKRKLKNISKPVIGHIKKALGEDIKEGFAYLKEFRIPEGEEINLKVGDRVDVNVFEKGDKVKVTARSKGKGFQGVVKRWHFAGGPKSHGQKDRLRAPGSIGATTPARVIKGKKMPGHAGYKQMTIKGLKIEKIDAENNLIAVKGAIPGPRGNLVRIISL